jgi:hypothetical protein
MSSQSERDDEWGFRIAMVLFPVLIPLLFVVAVWLSPRTSVLQGGEGDDPSTSTESSEGARQE